MSMKVPVDERHNTISNTFLHKDSIYTSQEFTQLAARKIASEVLGQCSSLFFFLLLKRNKHIVL